MVHDIDPVIVSRIIHHLFDPLTRETRKSTKALISPNLIIEFPFIPTASPSSSTRAQSLVRPTRNNRHSTSTQALSLFRLPGYLANKFPGGSWELRILSCSRKDEDENDNTTQIWTAQLEWDFQYETEVFTRLPLVGKKVQMKKVFEREVELFFEPVLKIGPTVLKLDKKDLKVRKGKGVLRNLDSPGMDDDEDDHSTTKKYFPRGYSSGSSSIKEDPFDLLLTRVKYSGIEVPKRMKSVPFLTSIIQLVSKVITSLFLSPFYGLLLLFGLGNSTPSFSPTATTTFDQRQKKREQISNLRRTKTLMASFNPNQFPVGIPEVILSDSESDGSEIQFDSEIPESIYHSTMRSLHQYYILFMNFLLALQELAIETKVEFIELFYSYRDLLRHLVESTMIGVQMFLGWVDKAAEEGEEISRRERELLEEDISDVIYGNDGMRNWNQNEHYSDTFSRISSMKKSPSKKSATSARVAFSFTPTGRQQQEAEDREYSNSTSSLFGPNLDQAELRRRTNPQNYSSLGYSTNTYGPRPATGSTTTTSRSNLQETFRVTTSGNRTHPTGSPASVRHQPTYHVNDQEVEEEEPRGRSPRAFYREAQEGDGDGEEGTNGYEHREAPVASGSGTRNNFRVNSQESAPGISPGTVSSAPGISLVNESNPAVEEEVQDPEDEALIDDNDSTSTITAGPSQSTPTKPKSPGRIDTSPSSSTDTSNYSRLDTPIPTSEDHLKKLDFDSSPISSLSLPLGTEELDEEDEEGEEEMENYNDEDETIRGIDFRSSTRHQQLEEGERERESTGTDDFQIKSKRSKEFGDFFPNLQSTSVISPTTSNQSEYISDTEEERETEIFEPSTELTHIVEPSSEQSTLEQFEDVPETSASTSTIEKSDKSREADDEEDERRFGDAVGEGEERSRLSESSSIEYPSSDSTAVSEEGQRYKKEEEAEVGKVEGSSAREELGDSPDLQSFTSELPPPVPGNSPEDSHMKIPYNEDNNNYDNSNAEESPIQPSSSEFSTSDSTFNYSPITPRDSPLYTRSNEVKSENQVEGTEKNRQAIARVERELGDERKIFESEGLGMDLSSKPEVNEDEKKQEAIGKEGKEEDEKFNTTAEELTTEVKKVKKKKNKSKKPKTPLELPLDSNTSISNTSTGPITRSRSTTPPQDENVESCPFSLATMSKGTHQKSPSSVSTASTSGDLLAGRPKKKGPKGGK